jgi:hypothetical protein
MHHNNNEPRTTRPTQVNDHLCLHHPLTWLSTTTTSSIPGTRVGKATNLMKGEQQEEGNNNCDSSFCGGKDISPLEAHQRHSSHPRPRLTQFETSPTSDAVATHRKGNHVVDVVDLTSPKKARLTENRHGAFVLSSDEKTHSVQDNFWRWTLLRQLL